MTKNVAASARARLSNQARERRRPFQELLQYFGLERFLYRYSRSQHSNSFLLKGALMLRVWRAPGSRPTRDIDFLGYVDNEIETLEGIVKEICDVEVEDDGFSYLLQQRFRKDETSPTTGKRPDRGSAAEPLRR